MYYGICILSSIIRHTVILFHPRHHVIRASKFNRQSRLRSFRRQRINLGLEQKPLVVNDNLAGKLEVFHSGFSAFYRAVFVVKLPVKLLNGGATASQNERASLKSVGCIRHVKVKNRALAT